MWKKPSRDLSPPSNPVESAVHGFSVTRLTCCHCPHQNSEETELSDARSWHRYVQVARHVNMVLLPPTYPHLLDRSLHGNQHRIYVCWTPSLIFSTKAWWHDGLAEREQKGCRCRDVQGKKTGKRVVLSHRAARTWHRLENLKTVGYRLTEISAH